MIVPSYINEQQSYRSAVTLEQYAKTVQYSECALLGVDNPNDRTRTSSIGDQCRDIWTLDQRNYILRYLTEAQIELENEIGMLFGSTWVSSDTSNDRLTDIQTYANSYYTKWNNVVRVGKLQQTLIDSNLVVDNSGDPAVVSVTIDPAIVTDINYVRLFEAGNFGSDKQLSLNPSAINIVGTTMTIEIPRCRIVKYDLRDNPVAGLDYDDLNNFISEVDVYYYSTVNTESITTTSSNCACGTIQNTGCLEILTTGITTVKESTDCSSISCRCNDVSVGLWYEAGEAILNQQQVDMIIRLAHSKMGTEPCGCSISQRLWENDKNVPDFLSFERLQCPFGLSDGAWIAWQWAKTMKKTKFGSI